MLPKMLSGLISMRQQASVAVSIKLITSRVAFDAPLTPLHAFRPREVCNKNLVQDRRSARSLEDSPIRRKHGWSLSRSRRSRLICRSAAQGQLTVAAISHRLRRIRRDHPAGDERGSRGTFLTQPLVREEGRTNATRPFSACRSQPTRSLEVE